MNNDEYFIPEDGTQEQFHQEWTQFCEEVEKQQALEDYVNALCSFYGNREE